MKLQNAYFGPERRQHHMFVTKNTEYHFRGDLCVGVRDRRSGEWLSNHRALSRRLSGGVHFHENGCAVPVPDAPGVGEALYFAEGGSELITSAVCDVDRPSRDAVSQYCE
jgi:hypothetical protein